MSDQPTEVLAEQVDAVDADTGGMPFDDELEDEVPPDDGAGRGGVAYDSPKLLQQRGIAYPATTPVGMSVLRSYVLGRWGGADLGILAKPPRPMRASVMPSLHNWGMAWDWRWAGPGPGRGTADVVIQFCIDNSDALGIQAVHDYQACKYWKSYGGWKPAKPSASTGMGQPWGQWLHIERTWSEANRGTSIDSLLTASGKAIDDAPAVEAMPDTELKLGSTGAGVGRMQDFLRMFGFADFTRSDGVFGPRTEAAVKKAQEAFAAKGWYPPPPKSIDGRWGPKSGAAATQWMAAARAA
jgi:hypothetical protein